jgi:hypothetical protein
MMRLLSAFPRAAVEVWLDALLWIPTGGTRRVRLSPEEVGE